MVNGVVSPSLRKPGESPIRTPYASKRDRSVTCQVRNRRCPICGDRFRNTRDLKPHFVACVRRNGNPQGFYWDGTLNESKECRIGRAIAELYCTRDTGGDLNSQTSTSDNSSDDDHHTSNYEPSVSRSDSQSSSSSSRAATPEMRHDSIHYSGAIVQDRAPINHDEGIGVPATGDKQVADGSLDTKQPSVAEQAEALPKTGQVNSLLQHALS